jgi:LmbE family N-acetylglucosaminyl deacetylase
MLPLAFGTDPAAPLSILCLGAHSDDIEIGCGGTVLRMLGERRDVTVHWVVFSADDAREAEARASAAAFCSAASESSIDVHRFRESYFPYVGAEIKDVFERLKAMVRPDVVFTHRREDEHQDHRMIASLTWNTFRDHLVLEYEIPKYEGDLGHPNLYVPLAAAVADRKIELLMEHFGSQRSKVWFRPETFRGVMSLRSIEANAIEGAAEGFYGRKLVV